LGFAVVVLIYPVIFAYLPSLLVVVATYSLLLHRRCFGLVLYLLLGFVGGTLMIFPLGGVSMAQKGPAQFTFFLALFFGLPGMLSGWVFWLIAVRPLQDRLKRTASIPINP